MLGFKCAVEGCLPTGSGFAQLPGMLLISTLKKVLKRDSYNVLLTMQWTASENVPTLQASGKRTKQRGRKKKKIRALLLKRVQVGAKWRSWPISEWQL